MDFPDVTGKNLLSNGGYAGWITGPGRSPGEENNNPLQYSCLENPWIEEPSEPPSMESQKNRIQLSNQVHQSYQILYIFIS